MSTPRNAQVVLRSSPFLPSCAPCARWRALPRAGTHLAGELLEVPDDEDDDARDDADAREEAPDDREGQQRREGALAAGGRRAGLVQAPALRLRHGLADHGQRAVGVRAVAAGGRHRVVQEPRGGGFAHMAAAAASSSKSSGVGYSGSQGDALVLRQRTDEAKRRRVRREAALTLAVRELAEVLPRSVLDALKGHGTDLASDHPHLWQSREKYAQVYLSPLILYWNQSTPK